jgi:predicted Zn-dependent peptidase
MFQRYKLPNGLRVITASLHETEAVTVMIFVKVGSRYETLSLNGASHFLEHLMFKGTQRRPDTLTISKELDGIGAEYNAFTSKDHTAYYVKCNRQHITLALDILADILVNSKFENKEVERERGVIIEEINMYEDNPMVLIEDVFERSFYGDTPLGWNIAGKKEGIAKMDRAAMLKYKNQYYVGPNMWLVAAGNLPKNFSKQVQQAFSIVPWRSRGKAFLSQPAFRGQRVTLKQKPTEQMHVMLGAPGLAYAHKELDVLALISIMLGGNMSSRLFIEVREHRGLCYFIRAGVSSYEGAGHFAIQAGLDKSRLPEAIPAILEEVRKVQVGGCTAEELRRAKEFIKGKFVLDLEDSEHIAGWLGRQALFAKRIKTSTQRIADIERVSLKQVQRVAKRLLVPEKFRLAVIGPFENTANLSSYMR